METANPILGNPLLLVAILLFLAILPWALRQKKKTALDRAVERFEKEELKAAVKEKSNKPPTKNESPPQSEGRPLDYLQEDQLKPPEIPGYRGIPPFPSEEEQDNKRKGKGVKEGVVVSYNMPSSPHETSKKKAKLIKQDISIAPDRNRETAKQITPAPPKDKPGKTEASSKGKTNRKNLPDLPTKDHPVPESNDNWVEAEIPGLIMDPPPLEESGDIPTFKASPKTKDALKTDKSTKEKQGSQVKNRAPHSEEKKEPKPKKQVEIKADSPELEIEISDSGPKQVEFNAPVVSHKNIIDKKDDQEAVKPSSSGNEKPSKDELEAEVVQARQKTLKTSSNKTRPKPFFLDLKFLDREEEETEHSVFHDNDNLSANRMEDVIDQLNILQADLEQQLVSITGPLTAKDDLDNENSEKVRTRESFVRQEDSESKPAGNTQVSLDELDAFLFTSRQRKNKE